MYHKECVVCKDWVCSECVVEHMVTCSDCSTACCFQCVGRITPVSALDGHSARSLAYLQPLVALEAAAVALAEEEILSNREDRAARVALLGKALAERALAIEKHEASAKVRAFARDAMGFEADGPDAEAKIHLPMTELNLARVQGYVLDSTAAFSYQLLGLFSTREFTKKFGEYEQVLMHQEDRMQAQAERAEALLKLKERRARKHGQPLGGARHGAHGQPLGGARHEAHGQLVAPKQILPVGASMGTSEVSLLVPAGAKADRKIEFAVDGVKYSAVLPEGLKAGDTFLARIPSMPAAVQEDAQHGARATQLAKRAEAERVAAELLAAEEQERQAKHLNQQKTNQARGHPLSSPLGSEGWAKAEAMPTKACGLRGVATASHSHSHSQAKLQSQSQSQSQSAAAAEEREARELALAIQLSLREAFGDVGGGRRDGAAAQAAAAGSASGSRDVPTGRDVPPPSAVSSRKAFVVLPKMSDPSEQTRAETALSRHFGRFGAVVSCRVRAERGCGFVEWTTPEAAARALAVPKHVIDELRPPSGSYSFDVLVLPFNQGKGVPSAAHASAQHRAPSPSIFESSAAHASAQHSAPSPSIFESIRALLVAHGGASLLSKLCSELYSVPGGSLYKEQIGAAGG
eukprot:jgi/Chrpa1/894/Chrysochromulina_OHIO_Genome00007170-RA